MSFEAWLTPVTSLVTGVIFVISTVYWKAEIKLFFFECRFCSTQCSFFFSLVISDGEAGGLGNCFDKFQHSTSKPPYPNTTLATETKTRFNRLLPCPLESRGTSWSCSVLNIVKLSLFFSPLFINEQLFIDNKKKSCVRHHHKELFIHITRTGHVPSF